MRGIRVLCVVSGCVMRGIIIRQLNITVGYPVPRVTFFETAGALALRLYVMEQL